MLYCRGLQPSYIMERLHLENILVDRGGGGGGW